MGEEDVGKRFALVLEGFPGTGPRLFTAAGRTELGGNHTDHQLGRVLAASVDVDVVAAAAPNGTSEVRIRQAGYEDVRIDVSDLAKRDREEGQFQALIRGVLAAVAERGFDVQGFTAVVDSRVPAGSGLSSSAAYEVLVANICNELCCGGTLTPVEIAQIGQFAENEYFGKPSGLMDQMACSVGGIIGVDFEDPAQPVVTRIESPFDGSGYTLCIVDCGADHADLTADYARITEDMAAVAGMFSARCLREVDPGEFRRRIPDIRDELGERAVLRALHFFEENARVAEQTTVLSEGRIGDFLALVRDSGRSSQVLLQNAYSPQDPTRQEMGLALAVAEREAGPQGAVRVHGGGFAGTIQAYVPDENFGDFSATMDAVFGEGCCRKVRIRDVGGAVITGNPAD